MPMLNTNRVKSYDSSIRYDSLCFMIATLLKEKKIYDSRLTKL